MQTYVINERVVSDDTIAIADEGHIFKGGYAAIVTYHTFQNPWEDAEHVRRFRSMDTAEAFIEKRYGKPLDDLIYGTDEDED